MTAVPGLITPSTENLMVGKGRTFFKPTGGSKFYLGNVPELEITPKATTLDHFDSQEGTRFKDKVIVTEKSGEVRVVMEEVTRDNLNLLLMGTVDNTDPDAPVISIFAQGSIIGEFWFYASNAQGPRWYVYLQQIEFKPSGGFSPISTEFAKMEVTGEMEAVDGVFGTATLQPKVGTIAPENFEIPKILDSDGNPVTTVVNGAVLTVTRGVNIGASSYTYQWKKDAVAIMGQTASTYTTVMGDASHNITCTVTAHNTTGTTATTSTSCAVT